MEKTRLVLLVGRLSSNINTTTTPSYSKLLTTKASNRAAVHGVKPPLPDIVDKDQVQKEIQKAIEEKEAKRKQIEKTIESHISNSSNSESSSAH